MIRVATMESLEKRGSIKLEELGFREEDQTRLVLNCKVFERMNIAAKAFYIPSQ
jgi:hypothetical protein